MAEITEGPGSFPEYLAGLQKVAEIDRVKVVDHSLRLENYLSSAQTLWIQASSYRLSEDWENLYVLLHRYLCLYINVLRKHNGAALKQYQKSMADCRINATASMKEMEQLVETELPNLFAKQQVPAPAPAPASAQPTESAGANVPVFDPSPQPHKPLVHWQERPVPNAEATFRPSPAHLPTPLYPAPAPGIASTALRPVVFPRGLIDEFLSSAAPTLSRGIEWCGIIAGTLQGGTLRCTHILIPRQTGTSDTCTALDEVDLFSYQTAANLLTIGWIHTHPRMDAFLSSVDLHTHANYQSLLPEAIAVVCSPTHRPTYAILRIADAALSVLHRCTLTGFHEHHSANGQKLHDLAEQCPHVVEVDAAPWPLKLVDLQ